MIHAFSFFYYDISDKTSFQSENALDMSISKKHKKVKKRTK